MRSRYQKIARQSVSVAWNVFQGKIHSRNPSYPGSVARAPKLKPLVISFFIAGSAYPLFSTAQSLKSEPQDPPRKSSGIDDEIPWTWWGGALGWLYLKHVQDQKIKEIVSERKETLITRYQHFELRYALSDNSDPKKLDRYYRDVILSDVTTRSFFQKTSTTEKAFFSAAAIVASSPHHILITGNAGVGKSTWSKRVAQKWAEGKIWKGKFEVVLYIPLGRLQERISKIPAETVTELEAWYEAFDLSPVDSHYEIEKEKIQLLKQAVEKKGGRVLYLVDGFDEVSQSPQIKEILKVLQKYDAIWTSKSEIVPEYFVVSKKVQLEGFDTSSQNQFISDYFQDAPPVEFEALLRKSPRLQDLARTPLLLEMLCYLYEKAKGGRALLDTTFLQQTEVYEAIITALAGRWLLKTHRVSQEEFDLLNDKQILERAEKLLDAIGSVALEAWRGSGLVIDLQNIVCEGFTLKDLGEDFGLLRSLSYEANYAQRRYEFIHHSFLEFLAARYAVKPLEKNFLEAIAITGCAPEITSDAFSIDGEYALEFVGYLFGHWSRVKNIRFKSFIRNILAFMLESERFDFFVHAVNELEKSFLSETRLTDFEKDDPSAAHHFSAMLLYSSGAGLYQSARWLLEQGISTDDKYVTPLHFAVGYQHADIVRLLISHRANINIRSTYAANMMPLHIAAGVGNAEIIEVLLKNGAEKEATCADGYTPLHVAVIKNHPLAVETLLKNKVDIEAKDELKCTPLHAAIFYLRIEIIRVLLQHGARLEETSPLSNAIQLVESLAGAKIKENAALEDDTKKELQTLRQLKNALEAFQKTHHIKDFDRAFKTDGGDAASKTEESCYCKAAPKR